MHSNLSSVHPNAKIGSNVTIEPFAVIDDNVVIGDGSHIQSHAVIRSGTRMGKNCNVFPGAVVGAVPQDLKFNGEETTLEIGDNVTIRECVTINRGTSAYGKTVIGNNNLIMAYCHIAHDCIIGNHCIFSNSVALAGHIIVEDHVIIGGLAAVHQFCKIGAHSFIGGGSLVNKDVPPFVKASRYPVSFLGINSVGLTRRGFSPEQIHIVGDIYRLLFVKNSNLKKGIQQVKEQVEDSPVKSQILDFIEKSERGLIKGYSGPAEEE
jgi:UDP-N-acetylglucosamine acyltransferase